MTPQKVRVKVPASTANLGPGFDSLGMALELYLWLDMSFAAETRVRGIGGQMGSLPSGKSNLVYQVAQLVFQAAGEPERELDIAMCSDIPLARGLGSSASAIVGALAAANALIGGKLSQRELLQLASRLEKHPDNVGASLLGGIVVAFWDGEQAEAVRLEPDARLEALVAIPSFQLLTEKARHALPAQVSMSDAVFNLSHSSLLVAALATGDFPMIRHAMKDRLHQPYRAALVPGMETILREAADHGALGAALSGAGPTMLALVDGSSGRQPKLELESFLRDTFKAAGVEAQTLWLKPSARGVEVLALEADSLGLDQIAADKGEVRA